MERHLLLESTLLFLVGIDEFLQPCLTALSRRCRVDLYALVGIDAHAAASCRLDDLGEGPLGIVALDNDIARLADNLGHGVDHMLQPVGSRVFRNLTDTW